jgi:hypothetical protein
MQVAYLGQALGALVTFRNEPHVFYPLNFAPTFVGADCAAVVGVGQSLGVYISPERGFRFSLAFYRGMCGLWGATSLILQVAVSVLLSTTKAMCSIMRASVMRRDYTAPARPLYAVVH